LNERARGADARAYAQSMNGPFFRSVAASSGREERLSGRTQQV